MPFVLPVPATVPDVPDATAQIWETAAPDVGDGPLLKIGGGSVALYRTGPGDIPHPRDEWMGVDVYDLGHQGVEDGRDLFVQIPGPPPEGHKGYDFPDTDQIQDRSTRTQALFWSDWYASTAANAGGGGSFRGEHVVIARIPPGSTQGYQPTDMTQLNVDRNRPTPWDTALTIGGLVGG